MNQPNPTLNTEFLPSKGLIIRIYRKRTPLVSDRDHFFVLTVLQFSIFFPSCQRLLDARSDPFVRCTTAYYDTHSIRKTFSDNMKLHMSQLRAFVEVGRA